MPLNLLYEQLRMLACHGKWGAKSTQTNLQRKEKNYVKQNNKTTTKNTRIFYLFRNFDGKANTIDVDTIANVLTNSQNPCICRF